jgi:hypothetical protein
MTGGSLSTSLLRSTAGGADAAPLLLLLAELPLGTTTCKSAALMATTCRVAAGVDVAPPLPLLLPLLPLPLVVLLMMALDREAPGRAD